MSSLGLVGARALWNQPRRSFFSLSTRAFASKATPPKEGTTDEVKHDDHGAFNWGADASYVPGREGLRETGERANRRMSLVDIIICTYQFPRVQDE